MKTFSEYEVDISERLAPLRAILAQGNIPIASLPREAAKYTQRYPGSLRVIVGHSYRGGKVSMGSQEVEIDATVIIRLADRYEDQPPPVPPTPAFIRKAAVDWVEDETRKLLLGFLLPSAASELKIRQAQLLPPEEGEWQKEITFSFWDHFDYIREETPTLDTAEIRQVKFTIGG
jgi:hypothetical protein